MILDGRALAQRIRDKIKQRVAALPSQPGLAVLLVGSDPASHTYVGIKQKACEEVGIHFEKYLYFASETEQSLIQKIQELNARRDIHGILVQLPLPTQNADRIIAEIDPRKDVDGFHPENLKRLKAGKPAIASAVALGIMKLIATANRRGTAGVENKKAVIVSSPLFAEPLKILLNEEKITTTICDANSINRRGTAGVETKTADVLIVAVGKPGLITGRMIKPGATVIDVGTTKIDGVLYGDVDWSSVEPIAGALTPVPGGVGPMTVAMLLVNVLKAYDLQRGEDLESDPSDK